LPYDEKSDLPAFRDAAPFPSIPLSHDHTGNVTVRDNFHFDLDGKCETSRPLLRYGFLNMQSLSLFFVQLKSLIIMKNGVFWVVTPCGSCKN
jgi:hypothetical protein